MLTQRTLPDGTRAYYKTVNGVEQRLTDAEVKKIREAQAYKRELMKKAGGGVAFAGGIAAAEVSMSGIAAAAETAAVAAETIALAPVILTGAGILATGAAIYYAVDYFRK